MLESLISFFSGYPIHVMLVSFILAAVYGFSISQAGDSSNVKNRPLLIAAVLWFIYSGWEYSLVGVDLPRYDLFIVYPVLLVFTLWGLISYVRSLTYRRSGGED